MSRFSNKSGHHPIYRFHLDKMMFNWGMARYIALLRGINVGGKNKILMKDLQKHMEDIGLHSVSTYIQSGNIIFSSADSAVNLASRIEKCLTTKLKSPVPTLVLSQKQLQKVVAAAPPTFGQDPRNYRYMVFFLFSPLRASQVLQEMPLKEGVDQAATGPRVVYHSRLEKRATQSKLGRIMGLPIYQKMTLRNWNTTVALAQYKEESPAR